MLGNKAHKTSWNYTFLGNTPNRFGELISVKQARKTPDDYTKILFWEYCSDFVRNMFGFLHSFRRISGAVSLLDLHNRESSWRRFKTRAGRLLGEQKRETHRDSLKPSSDYMRCRKRRVINYTKISQGN